MDELEAPPECRFKLYAPTVSGGDPYWRGTLPLGKTVIHEGRKKHTCNRDFGSGKRSEELAQMQIVYFFNLAISLGICEPWPASAIMVAI